MKSHEQCNHPGCKIPKGNGATPGQCRLSKPLMISIPPGEHIHLDCPVHPEGHVLFGPKLTMMVAEPLKKDRLFKQGIDYSHLDAIGSDNSGKISFSSYLRPRRYTRADS